jgi:hypothetical protein
MIILVEYLQLAVNCDIQDLAKIHCLAIFKKYSTIKKTD